MKKGMIVGTFLVIMLMFSPLAYGDDAGSPFYLSGRLQFMGIGGDVGQEIADLGGGIGFTVGYWMSPVIALEGHLDLLGVSPERNYIESAGYTSFLGGIRLALTPPDRPLHLYLSGGMGFSLLTWRYDSWRHSFPYDYYYYDETDGLGAFTLYTGLGIDGHITPNFLIGLFCKYHYNAWDEETLEDSPVMKDMNGNALIFGGTMTIAFGAR